MLYLKKLKFMFVGEKILLKIQKYFKDTFVFCHLVEWMVSERYF